MFRVIIAGGRDFNDYPLLEQKMDMLLSNIDDDIAIICGMAKGADSLGERYAKERSYPVAYYPANWAKYGKAAGFLRNEQMALNADALVAFWDGQSKGTQHMIGLAQKHKLKTRIVRY